MTHHNLTRENIRQFFLENEGKVSNKALVKHFKKALKGSENADNRAAFKAIVDELATVWKEKKGHILQLRPQFFGTDESEPSPGTDQENQEPGGILHPTTLQVVGATARVPPEMVAALDKQETPTHAEELKLAKDVLDCSEPAEVNVPFSPLKEDSPSSEVASEEKLRAGSVLEKARNFDAVGLEEDIISPAKILRSATNEDKCVCASAHLEEETSTSRFSAPRASCVEMRQSLMPQLDEVKRKWMIMSAKCDYQAMARLLQDHHHLSGWKNFTNGYSALHYAAKFGNIDCIKLLAGKHNANVNSITQAGMTPLHLCALHSQGLAVRLLVETYRADPNIRDYRGKLAKDYLNESRLTSSPINYEVLRLHLSGDAGLSRDTLVFLKDCSNIQSQFTGDTLLPREGGTLKHEAPSSGSNSILRRSFRVGTGRPADISGYATSLGPPETAGQSLDLRKGSYGGTLSEKQKEAMVVRSKSLSRPRVISNRQHLRQQNRVTSMVTEIAEEPSD